MANRELYDLLDEADRLNSCWAALASLLCPVDQELDRDCVAVLVQYLTEQQADVLERLHKCRKAAA